MMRISPLCWVFGHSHKINLLVRTASHSLGPVISTKAYCARCGEAVPERINRVTVDMGRQGLYVKITSPDDAQRIAAEFIGSRR